MKYKEWTGDFIIRGSAILPETATMEEVCDAILADVYEKIADPFYLDGIGIDPDYVEETGALLDEDGNYIYD